MRGLKISLILPLLIGVLVAIGVVQSTVTGFEIAGIGERVDEVGRNRLPRTVALGEMRVAHSDVRRAYALVLGARDQDALKAASDSAEQAERARDKAFSDYEKFITLPRTRELFSQLSADVTAYGKLGDELVTLVGQNKPDEALALYNGKMREMAIAADKEMIKLIDLNKEITGKSLDDADGLIALTKFVGAIMAVISLLVGAFAAFIVMRRVVRPLGGITASMTGLAAGDTLKPIPHADRRDEIGQMAAAVEVFRQSAIERANLERAAEENRSASEQERLAREEQKAREVAEVKFAVDQLAASLQELSAGNLEIRIDAVFAAQLDQLRENFNASVTRLANAMREVGENARNIDAGAKEILSGANDLSKRTEQQAASVEETAAALEQVTTAVKDSSRRAEEAGNLVEKARQSAEQSGAIVSRAIDAMSQIDRSSGEIANIISVIDEIAFQTNLLALNAGVEAARAGEAGKGFAVVAQEVRELAQRSANAAKEIKALISASGEHVRNGVELVSMTGQALNEIVTQVQQINQNVGAIVTSSREQSTGLQEINVAVNQMDQGTQQNAAMVEQSTAASHGLAEQAAALSHLLSQFRLGGTNLPAVHAVRKAAAPQASPARAPVRRVVPAMGAGAAVRKEEEWSEF
jgi:methyl-accepting chemotaxis protein